MKSLIKKQAGIDLLIDLAVKFVENRQRAWDQTTAWLDFLLDIQKKGFELSEDMKSNLNLVLESMKNFYDALTATKGMENVAKAILEQSMYFFKKNRGKCNFTEWEAFIKNLQKEGLVINEEVSSYLWYICLSFFVTSFPNS